MASYVEFFRFPCHRPSMLPRTKSTTENSDVYILMYLSHKI